MQKLIVQVSRRASGVGRVRRSRSARTPLWSVSTLLLLAAVGACGGDDSNDGVMTETGAQTPTPNSMTPGAMMPAGMMPAEAAPSNPTPGAGEGMSDGMLPLEPGEMEGEGAGMMAAETEGNAPEEMPPVEEPPVEEPPVEEPPVEEPPVEEPPVEEPPAEEPPVEEPPVEEPPAFAPCPTDGSPCRIMPLGDSITHGFIPNTNNQSVGGYRVELFRQAVLDGHSITFVGPQQPNGPDQVEGQPFPRNHAGISGDTIQGVSGRVDAAIAATDPHIILLHIGTNHLAGSLPNGLLNQLGDLLEQITDAAPDALLVVAQIIPRRQGNDPTEDFNAGIPALVEERAAEGDHVVSLDMFTPFVNDPAFASLLPDNLHPTVEGYNLMAETWYEAIESFLP
jgi:lysophospholipase L1-like esterase